MAVILMLAASAGASAGCKYVWVDHDYNTMTPAIQKQVCDNTYDVPAIRSPSIRPIQKPQVRPIETPSVPLVGTTRCRTQSVYENGQWVNKQICN